MNATRLHNTGWNRRIGGVTLVELMLAMTIGAFLLGGALMVFMQGRRSHSVNDTLARLQDDARFALSIMEPDIRMAGFWGMHNDFAAVSRRAQDPLAGPLATPVTNDCAARWSIDLDVPIEGSNDLFPAWAAPCMAGGDYTVGTDTLVVRHGGQTALAGGAPLSPGQIFLRSDPTPRGELFVGPAAPVGYMPGVAQTNILVTNGYFVRPWWLNPGDGVSSLQRMSLVDGGGLPLVQAQEVIPGVEDLQIQFGVDLDGDFAVDSYVNTDAVPVGSAILAVRLWLLMRSDRFEVGFTDDATYTYAGRVITPSLNPNFDERFRRLLVTKTVQLRNL